MNQYMESIISKHENIKKYLVFDEAKIITLEHFSNALEEFGIEKTKNSLSKSKTQALIMRLSKIDDEIGNYENWFPDKVEYNSHQDYIEAILRHNSCYSSTSSFTEEIALILCLLCFPATIEEYEKMKIGKESALINYQLFDRDKYIVESNNKTD